MHHTGPESDESSRMLIICYMLLTKVQYIVVYVLFYYDFHSFSAIWRISIYKTNAWCLEVRVFDIIFFCVTKGSVWMLYQTVVLPEYL